MLDTEEAIAHQKEIGEMLREKLTDEDEDEILRELEGLTNAPEVFPRLTLPSFSLGPRYPSTPIALPLSFSFLPYPSFTPYSCAS